MRKVGDLFTIPATGEFYPGIDCIVLEVKDGRIIKAKAAEPDERLLRKGFILEGDDMIICEWHWSEN